MASNSAWRSTATRSSRVVGSRTAASPVGGSSTANRSTVEGDEDPSKCGVVISDGHVWAAARAGFPERPGPDHLAVFRLATGAETGRLDLGSKVNYTHLAAADGFIGMSSYGANGSRLVIADPKAPRFHGELLPDTTYCITPAMADGLLLTRIQPRHCWRIAE